MGSKPNSLLFWAYAIGCFDLIVALLFTTASLRTICQRLSWLTIFAILFGIFWLSMIAMLLFGIHGRKPRYVRVWIIFSLLGILAEMFLILYAIFSQSSFHQGLVRNGILLVLGLIVEFIFLYIVHRFYVTVAYCEVCQEAKAQDVDPSHCHTTEASTSSPYPSLSPTHAASFLPSHDPSSRENNFHPSSANPLKLSWLQSLDRNTVP